MKWRGVPVVLSWTVLLGLPWFYYKHRGLLGMAADVVCFDPQHVRDTAGWWAWPSRSCASSS